MSSCNGDGEFLTNQNCRSRCCMPIKCRNYKYCNQKIPEWVTKCHNGMCMGCAILMGRHEYTYESEDCCICLENKIMLILKKCNHKVCNDCWYGISKELGSLCVVCETYNGW